MAFIASGLDLLGLNFRPETPADAGFIQQLYAEMRWKELAQVTWPDEHKLLFLAQQCAAQRQHYARAYYDAEFLVIERADTAIGRLYLYRGAPQDIRIVDIGLLMAWRNQGLGRHILEAVFAEARATGRNVSIHVEIFNPARRLYDRLGFVETGEHGPYRLMQWRADQLNTA